ncbi:MAG TPA: hypothetical protein VGD95_08825, partial [Micavibrio sp.]
MTASSQAVSNAQPAMAGFIAHPAKPNATNKPQYAGLASKGHGAQNAQGQNGNGQSGNANGTAPTAAPLHAQFNHAEFLALLAKLYGIPEIDKDLAAKLEGFKLDAQKGAQTLEDGTLFAQYGNDAVEITTTSVLTDAKITPDLAYKMAAAAAANPNVGKLTLEGSDDDKIMLFLAAQHLGLKIEESSIPALPANITSLAQSFHQYEQDKGLKPIAAEYLQPATQQTK